MAGSNLWQTSSVKKRRAHGIQRVSHGIQLSDQLQPMAGDQSLPARRDQPRGQDSQNRRFSRAICSQQCDCFAFLHFERDTPERRPRSAFKWLEIRAYSGARWWRTIFLQILQDNSGERHGILQRIFVAFPALQYKPDPNVGIARRNRSQSGLGNATIA